MAAQDRPLLPAPDVQAHPDVAAVQRIDAMKTVLRVLLQTTGLRLAVVARVTPDSWTCCATLDEMGFGLKPGDRLEVATTLCHTVSTTDAPLLVTHASRDPRMAHHPAPKLYGVESYIAVPLYRRDGSHFGVLCALDSLPAVLGAEKLEVFRHMAELVGHQLEQQDALGERDAQLLGAKETAKLREQLLGIVSHDLRNPLSTITLTSAALLRRTGLDDRTRTGLGRILTAADRAHRLIRDLLDFTQVRTGRALPVRPAPMDLAALAAQVVDEVQPEAPGRRLELHCAGDARGRWDPDRMGQVLTNLLTNAVQYSPPDSRVRVEVEGEPEGVVLRVSNGGAPIPAHALPTLFEPMSRGTAAGGERRSVGLGLFIVEQVVRAHGGAVAVHSAEGEGTTFTVRLPRG
jgi:signal transduction histidine kinase